ncbi:hypothetical protein KBB96_13545 [Luteolibacter ambystomatis]|uniref:DUF5703 domain-containing protein n=1 Tax=Luteolibacter ambystomatis TaxID=2824561 RepID=A0A975IY92_9BACT|nr:DUF5703 domain-containing protein [Luteolibacter ambystomatis]QUE49889.1 hypothetical protein KBB96_13545 [Luteolibacter ambystomatis]
MHPFLASLIACILIPTARAESSWDPLTEISRQDVIWTTHGTGEADNLPLGNGRAGANVWVVPDGDLELYLSHNDAVSELHRLLKLGKLKVRFDPSPFGKDEPIRQQLVLRGGRIELSAGAPDRRLDLQLWIDSETDVLHLTGTSAIPRRMTVTLDNWRTEKRTLNSSELASTWVYRTGIQPGIADWESADTIKPHAKGLMWYHRNAYSCLPTHFEHQGLGEALKKFRDPLENRTSGVLLAGRGLKGTSPTLLDSPAPLTTFDLRAAIQVSQTPTPEEWEKQTEAKLTASVSPEESRARTTRWWDAYWQRSWLFVDEGSAPIIPRLKHPLKFGSDQGGNNRLDGEIGEVVATPEVLPVQEIARLSTIKPLETKILDRSVEKANALTASDFTLMVRFIPKTPGGRLFDSITPGGNDGMLLDTHDGLRFIFGNHTLQVPVAWKPGNAYAATCVVSTSRQEVLLYLNDQLVAQWSEAPSPVTRAYVLSKLLTAMQARAETPAHFQGGIFTVAPPVAFYATNPATFDHTPDYRFYGCSYWWQNARFIYLPLLAQGWNEPVRKFIEFYASKRELFNARAKHYYNARGVYFQETVNLAGLPGMGDFGWGAKEYSEGYTRNIWQQALELTVLMQDYYEHTGDEKFLKDTLIPWANDALAFYDTRFEKKDGRIRIEPTHAVETYWTGVVDDMPSVAGLHAVTAWLLKLPASQTSAADRANWERIAKALPPLPKRTVDGVVMPDNAAAYNPQRSNYESPDLYSVFPFRVYGMDRKEQPIAEAIAGWKKMPNPGHVCWYQTGVIAARLGLAEGAKQDVVLRAKNRMARSDKSGSFLRFPGYLGSPHDWCPDFDGPGNMMNTLQEMILQPGPDGEILLTPAWPADWSAKFRLHAAGNVFVEGTIVKGKLTEWKTIPESAKARARVKQ